MNDRIYELNLSDISFVAGGKQQRKQPRPKPVPFVAKPNLREAIFPLAAIIVAVIAVGRYGWGLGWKGAAISFSTVTVSFLGREVGYDMAEAIYINLSKKPS